MLARLIVLTGVLCGLSSCESPCDVVFNSPTSVCLHDAGTIQPGVPFVLRTNTTSSTPTCEPHLNGTQLDLVLTGNICTNNGVLSAEPIPPMPAFCTLQLPAGTYSVRGTPTTFTVPGSDVPACDVPNQAANF